MILSIQFNDRKFTVDTDDGTSLAIPMDFEGPQPNHFGAPKASKSPIKLGGFVGDTTGGGSCNVDSISLTPHCNGTHTETVGHIVDDDIFIGHGLQSLMTATVVTLQPVASNVAADQGDDYRPALGNTDKVITRKNLEDSLSGFANAPTDALIIRTHSDESKRTVAYNEDNYPAFLTVQAMEWIVAQGISHLLLDLPSVDRMYDDGLLTNHHLFWKVKEGSHKIGANTNQDKTITEMIFVPSAIRDGLYLLNLQVPALGTDAAPSNPVVFVLKD